MQMKYNVPPRRRSSISHYYKYSLNHQLFSHPRGLPWGLDDSDKALNPKSSLVPRHREGQERSWSQALPAPASLGRERLIRRQPELLSAPCQLNFHVTPMENPGLLNLQTIYKAFTKYLLIWLVMYLSRHFLSACYWLYWHWSPFHWWHQVLQHLIPALQVTPGK